MGTDTRMQVDLLDPELYRSNPHDVWAWMRANEPVYRDEKNGLWGITRHADVMDVERRSMVFSSVFSRISPETYSAGGVGNSCRMDKEVTDLPEPDSPTMASNSPRETDMLIFFNACVRVPSVTKWMLRFLMCNRGWDMGKDNREIL